MKQEYQLIRAVTSDTRGIWTSQPMVGFVEKTTNTPLISAAVKFSLIYTTL